MKKILKKVLVYLSVIAIVVQSLSPLAYLQLNSGAYAQTVDETTASPTPTDTPTTVDQTTPPADTQTPTPTPDTIVPAPTDTPTPSDTVSETPIPTPTDAVTPEPTPVDNLSPPVDNSQTSTDTSAQVQGESITPTPASNAADATPTPTQVPENPKDEQLNLIILDNVSAPTVNLDAVVSEGSAVLTTDKPDYAPTDTALITGTGLLPNTTYSLRIWSDDAPATSTTVSVTSDENGVFAYAYQLDGTYRPNYKAELKDSAGNVVATVTFTDSPVCMTDAQGPNDEPGQKDLNKMCSDVAGLPTTLTTSWNWDDIAWSGNNTGDACNLVDTDNDNKANYSLCVRVSGNPASFSNLVLFSCTDGRADRCTGSAQIPTTSTCAASVQNQDPFPGPPPPQQGDAYPNDTVASCTINMSDFGSSDAKLLDVCSYPSQQPNSDPSDCIFAPTDNDTGTIEVVKQLVPDTDTGRFNLQIDEATVASNQGDNGTTGQLSYSTGAHTVGEIAYTGTNLADYTSAISCVNSSGSNQGTSSNAGPLTITLDKNEDIVCTITNTRINNGSITIVKESNPNDAQDFAFTAGGGLSPTTFNLDDDADGTLSNTRTFSNLGVGTYSVSEGAVTSWTSDGGVCSNGSPVSAIALATGENVTCTFTNTKQATVVVQKNTTGGDGTFGFTSTGANGLPASFNVSTTTGNGSQTYTVTPGVQYGVSETVPSGWSLTSSSCTSGTPSSFTPTAGETVTCTFNNTKKGHIIVNKVTDPSQDPQSFTFTTTGTGYNGFSLTDQAAPNDQELVPGTYSVAETVPSGWTQTSAVCDNQQTPESISLQAGETVTCTFNNTKKGHVIIEKNAVPDSSQIFTFNNNFGNGNPATFNLTDDSTSGLPSYDAEVLPGKYAVSEDPVTGWQLDGTSCDQGETVNDIDIAAGETVTCTFTNEKLATITLIKNTVGGDAAFDFDATGTGLPTDIDLTTVAGTASQTFNNLNPDNTYTIAENEPAGWTNTSASCDNGDLVSNITPNAGEVITCIFTNTRDTGTITILKNVDNNNDGDVTDQSDVQGATDWTWDIANGEQNIATGQSRNLVTGNYTVSEDGKTDYHLVGWTCTDQTSGLTNSIPVNLASNGQSITCTITNAINTGTVVVHKDVQGPNGEDVSDQSSSFEASLDGGTGQLIFDNNAHTYNNVLVGNHTITESLIDSDYTLYGISTAAGQIGTPAGLVINVGGGQTIDVYITNRQKSGTITLVKDVVKSDGVTDVSDSHLFHVTLNGETKDLAEGTNAVFTVNPGTYTASENDDVNYDELGCLTATGKTDIEVASGQSVTITCKNKQNPGSISGTKFDDLGSVLGGWTIDLYLCTGLGIGCGALPLASTFTGTDGSYTFSNLLSGFYTVAEGMQTGWTYITDWFHDLTVGPGDNIIDQDFTNKGDLSITACKYEDSNGTLNGGNFTNVDNWNFTLSGEQLEDNILQNTEDSNCTTFTDLKPGTYTVTELSLPSGWFIADDSQGSRQVVLTDENENVNFYNYQKGSITGTKWSDADGDSEFGDEEVLSNWTIFIDEDENEELGSGETSTLTDQDGNYVLSNLDPGIYIVCEVVENGWVQTYPDSVCHEVTVTSGNESSDNDFGNQGQGTIIVEKDVIPNSDATFNFTITGSLIEEIGVELGDEESRTYDSLPTDTYAVTEESNELYTTTVDCVSNQEDEEFADSLILDPGETITCTYTNTRNTGDISGSKFEDLNGDGVWDEGEQGLDGWTIKLYTDDDEEPGDIVDSTETSDDPLGEYKFEGVPTGSYFVCEEGQDGWYQSAPNTNGGCYPVTLSENGEQITDRDFGNFQPIDVIVIKNVVDPSGNPVVDTSTQFDFVLGDHGFSLTDGGQATYGLNPGKYDVTETLNANYNFQGCTVSGGTSNNPVYDEEDNLIGVSVNVNSGDNEVTVTCVNKQKPGTITGTKWSDLNENGIRDCELFDDGESDGQFCETYTDPGLQNWHIQLFVNNDGSIGNQVGGDQITGSDGSYTFPDVAPGGYFVCEVGQTGWNQTYPDLDQEISNCWEITVVSNGDYSNKDFGNHNLTPILTISKVNDASGDKSPGNSVGFTITVAADEEGGPADNVQVVDLLPKGFVFNPASWKVVSSDISRGVSGDITSLLTAPTYASPGTWSLDHMNSGETLTLTYTATIDGSQQTGTYYDNAWGQGTAVGSSDIIFARAIDPGDLDPSVDPSEFVGTQVSIINPSQPGVDYKATSTQEVLGAATYLPATGENTLWVIIATLLSGLGLGSLFLGFKLRRKYAK